MGGVVLYSTVGAACYVLYRRACQAPTYADISFRHCVCIVKKRTPLGARAGSLDPTAAKRNKETASFVCVAKPSAYAAISSAASGKRETGQAQGSSCSKRGKQRAGCALRGTRYHGRSVGNRVTDLPRMVAVLVGIPGGRKRTYEYVGTFTVAADAAQSVAVFRAGASAFVGDVLFLICFCELLYSRT